MNLYKYWRKKRCESETGIVNCRNIFICNISAFSIFSNDVDLIAARKSSSCRMYLRGPETNPGKAHDLQFPNSCFQLPSLWKKSEYIQMHIKQTTINLDICMMLHQYLRLLLCLEIIWVPKTIRLVEHAYCLCDVISVVKLIWLILKYLWNPS